MNFRYRPIFCIFLFIPLWTAFAGGRSEKPWPEGEISGGKQLEEPGHPSELVAQGFPQSPEPNSPNERGANENSAETVFRAIAQAYPDRTREPEFRDGDWTIEVYGEIFYFAQGRLLPASLREKINEYDPQPFYNYTRDLPVWQLPTAKEAARIKEYEALRRSRPPRRSQYFYDALWRTRSRDEAWEHIKQIFFLGQKVQVHYSILAELSLVEEQILREAKTNAAVKQWVNNLKTADGWSWRNISATQSRSFHAYGAAVDLLPKSLGGLETYWLWTARSIPEWWTVPYAKRFHPPQEVIKAFESFGFIWGGKWRYYDTMHFEYRPEILVLSGINRKDLRDLR